MVKKSKDKKNIPVLVVLYNGYFSGNVEKVEYIHKDRFTHIYHLIPFYKGAKNQPKKSNIIPIYENFIFFQGFITQGLRDYNIKDASHYIFISDDLLLHPKINENNYAEFFNLSPTTSFINNFRNMPNAFSCLPWRMKEWWSHQWAHAPYAYRLRRKASNSAFDITDVLPDTATIIEKFKRLGLLTEHISKEQINRCDNEDIFSKSLSRARRYHHMLRAVIMYLLTGKDAYRPYELDYPLVMTISDLVVIPQANVEDFAHYCGIFAATNLFVEIAIPTAMILSQDEFRFSSELPYKTHRILSSREIFPFKEEHLDTIDNIIKHWPQDYLFIHPIKLSSIKIC